MELELIPLPISILFVAVLAIVCLAVLFKLRKRGKVYSILFKASLLIVLLILIAILYATVMGMLT